MSETDDAVDSAARAVDRVRNRQYPAPVRSRRRPGVKTRIVAIAAVNAAILIAATVLGLILPLGMFGALAVMLLMLVATMLIAFAPPTPIPSPERLRQSEIKTLPAQTARWLDAQRPALPAPAISLVDKIGTRLDTLGAQIAALDQDAPAALEVRRLVGEQLPEFVRDYQRVPAELRGVPRNGKTPDRQLVDGLELIEREIGEMTSELAQGDLDTLATRGRYLEIKYQGDEAAG